MSLRRTVIHSFRTILFACVFWPAATAPLSAQDGVVGDLFESFFGTKEASKDEASEAPAQPTSDVSESNAVDNASSEDDPFGAPVENASATKLSSDEKINILDNYQAAVAMSQLHQRPLFIVFGAEWCSWCRKLEKELAQPEAEPILRQWVVAKIDVDANPDVAQKMSANALPALRVVGIDQSIIARHEGYMPVDELRAWLDQSITQADPALQKVLYDSGSVSETDLPTLLGFLSNRSPDVRRAAAQRITQARSDCAGAVVDVLRAGGLSQRLCAVEILTTWQAPVESLDPWQPETITKNSLAPVMNWLRNQTTERDTTATERTSIDTEQAASIVEALINSNEANAAAAMSQAIQHGDAMLPQVRLRLAASELPDEYRIKLRELLYRILAGERLRLQNNSQFILLSGLDGQTRRDAASKLLASANSQDEPLIDELSGDTDVLVREMSIPKLHEIGALQDKSRLARLLADKSPSVRTSVLRHLSEHRNESAIETLIQYIQSETDEDLLVYAAKTLGQLGDNKAAEEALVKLVSNASWRIRAAALDSIAETIKKKTQYGFNDSTPAVSGALADAVLKATSDSDAFVSERASVILPTTISPSSAESIALYLFEQQDQLKHFEEAFHDYDREQKLAPLINVLQKWLKGQDPPKIRCAATVLAKLNPTSMQTQLPTLLQSKDIATQMAAMEATVHSLALYRNEEIKNQWSSETHKFEPWFPIPDDLLFENRSKNKSSQPIKPSAAVDVSSEQPVSPPASDPNLDALDGLFGDTKPPEEAPATQEEKPKSEAQSLDALSNFFGDAPASVPAEVKATEKEDSSQKKADKDLEGLPSVWLANWYRGSSEKSVPWVTQTVEALKSLEFETSEQSPLALRWKHLSLLAAGDVNQNPTVVAELLADSPTDAKVAAPSAEQTLPWILPENRLQFLMAQQIDWTKLSDVKKGHPLISATEIDDIPTSDWLFDSLNKSSSLATQDIQNARRLIVRALLAFPADNVSPYVSENAGYGESSVPLRGSGRAWKWLQDHFSQAQTPELRATLLLASSYVDHTAGVKNAIGYVAQAEKYDISVKIAALTALADKNAACTFIAKKWLNHPFPEVRELAADRLLSTSSQFLEHWRETDIRFVYDYQTRLPIFWSDSEPISQDTLTQAIATATNNDAKQNLKLLLFASGGQVSIDELQFSSEAKKVLVVGAMAKRQIFEDAALEYCEKLSESVSRENAPILYLFCKSIGNDRIASVRKRLRDKFGGDVLEL